MYNMNTHMADTSITIRMARQTDLGSLIELAERDSASLPRGELLVAEGEGEIRAAISISHGTVIADPFHPTDGLVRLLAARVDQLRGRGGKGLRAKVGRALGARRKRGLSPQPAGTLRAFD